MIEVCFSRSYTQRKTADLAGSAVFILSVSIFHKLHLNDLLQTSRLIVHPRLHTSYIVRLYGTVTNVTAAVISRPDTSENNRPPGCYGCVRRAEWCRDSCASN